MPAARLSSFSGIRPTESSRVSQAMSNSVPGIGLRVAGSTSAIVTPVTRSRPCIAVTVWLKRSGMSLSTRHCTMLRLRPEEYGISSQTIFTFAPSQVMRRAMMRPMSPEPSITTSRPGRYPSMLHRRCAQPAV